MIHRFRFRKDLRIFAGALIVALVFLSELILFALPRSVWLVIVVLAIDFVVVLNLLKFFRYSVILDLQKGMLKYLDREIPISSIIKVDKNTWKLVTSTGEITVGNFVEDREWLFELLNEYVVSEGERSGVFR
ncbi:MAG: hypothetical protein J7L52_02675 [Thermotogae bacterium]|nr:hypothetical protein [Thermotogota bacterium]